MHRNCGCHNIHRRTFLADMGMGFTGLALGAMLHRDGYRRADAQPWAPPDGKPHFAAEGQERHLAVHERRRQPPGDASTPSRCSTKYAGKTIAETPFKDAQDPEKLKLARVVVVNDANGQQRNKLYPLQVGFKKRGQSGIEVSDWLPHLGECIDDIAVVRSMYTTDDNHGAQTQFHSGRHMLDGEFPTLGAWVHYGLGSLNDNLPQFISMGKREYWNAKDGHYLGPAHDAVPLRIDPANPLDYGKPEGDVTARRSSRSASTWSAS